MRARIFIALSLTTVLFFSRWESVESALGPHGRYFRTAPLSTSYIASLYGTMIAAALIFLVAISVAVKWMRLSNETAYRIAGVLLATGLLTLVPGFNHSRSKLFLGALVISGCALLWRRFSDLGRLLVTLVTALFFIKSASFAWLYAQPQPDVATKTRSSTVSSSAAPKRIVWLLFDEFDYELAVSLRPPSVQMPEFDRLLKETLVATDAHSPAENTVKSVPSFFIGKRVTDAFPRGPRTLALRIGDSTTEVPWDAQDTLFAKAQRSGLLSSVVGWHHPYCRIFGSTLETCFSETNISASDSLRKNFVLHRTGPTPMLPGWPLVPYSVEYAKTRTDYRVVAEEQIEQYRNQRARAVEALRNVDLDFIFVHWLIPHPPGIYDRRLDKLSAAAESNFLDNMELVDATIGEVRRTLERAGLWESTALVVTGDHPLRASMWAETPLWTREEANLSAARKDPRVPLLIKIPGQQAGATYPVTMDAVMVHELIAAWMTGECSTVEEIQALFARHESRFPVHGHAVSQRFGK